MKKITVAHMNRALIWTIVALLAVGVGYWAWWYNRDTTVPPMRDPTQYSGPYTDLSTLKPGDIFGVFTVESVTQDEKGNYEARLRGEKVVRGRYVVVGGPSEPWEAGDVCLHTFEVGGELVVPHFSQYGGGGERLPS